MIKNLTVCPGCGIQQPNQGYSPDGRLNASGECWYIFGELSAYTLTLGHAQFIHQHAVDTYGAQHAVDTSRIRTAFALIGLYLALENGYTGRDAQRAHTELARLKRDWPRFEPPPEHAALTVLDVMQTEPGESRDKMLMQWAMAVWVSWHDAHEWTRRIVGQLLQRSRDFRMRTDGR